MSSLSEKPTQELNMDKKVLQMYEALQNSIDTMDHKVEIVMKKHQSQFLYAYRMHIKKIKKELQQIKNKSQEQQKMFSANDRIRYLQKQISIFREEAIKLYDKLEKKNGEFVVYQQKMDDLKMTASKHQIQNKQLVIKNKKLESLLCDYQGNIQELENRVEEQNMKIKDFQKKLRKRAVSRSFAQTTKNLDINLEKIRKSPVKEIKIYRNQLQQWFIECIKTVKKEIHQRKNNFQSINISTINNINDFKLVDKLKLFELFLQNEKILNWLYQKIFPDRMDHISMQLTQQSAKQVKNSEISSARESSEGSRRYNEEVVLPRMTQSVKQSAMLIRNRVIMRNGKMSFI